jgi:GH15 family glucan-1,4-alpha-glucosidase
VLEWLPGYEHSRPVRVGNAASEQLQLDVYGEVIDALYQTRKHGAPPNDHIWSLMTKLLEWLEVGWRLEDAGIWEVRGPNRHFTHSKMMAWVAFDRGVRCIDEFGREGPRERWAAIRDEIHAQVVERAWNEEKQAYAQSYGADALDASVLLMPLVGFLPADDPRFASTVDAIQRELTREGLVLRYLTEESADGLPGDEGVFLPCSFWLAAVLAMQGKAQEATELFERLLDLRNDVGLLPEEYDPVAGRHLGNFPQALTHLALVNTAFVLGGLPSMRELAA